MTLNTTKWIEIHPPFWQHVIARAVFLDVAAAFEKLIDQHEHVGPATTRAHRELAVKKARQQIPTEYQAVSLALHILGDLVNQGWQVRVQDGAVRIAKPERGPDRDHEKQRVRRSLLLARDEQLSELPTREFVKRMESRQCGPCGWTSIYSLMRDGKELARILGAATLASSRTHRLDILRDAIQPYMQVISEDDRCEWTGLRLNDIWRYFRYTWLTPARSVPGRSMNILFRDAAITPHPVIGIASLSSAIVQQSQRDRSIGWDKSSVLGEIESSPTDALAQWLEQALTESLDGIYTGDLVTADEIADPSLELIERLTKLGADEMRKHQVHGDKLGYRKQQHNTDWRSLVLQHLYRAKRASTLAGLLSARRAFSACGFDAPTAENLRRAIKHRDFGAAVGRLVRQIKAAHVGINMMDISVAGAIAPYQSILGGKLVSLLLASPEVREAYAGRYGKKPSIIASAMKGVPVQRRPELVLLCTTGLFAGGSSQYNRVRLPAAVAGGIRGEVRYEQLTTETEFATFHISQATIEEMKVYVGRTERGATVNGIFGEGVNPKMRKIREGLQHMGFPPEEVLKAGSPRAVYMIALAHNYRDVLLGRADVPDYILPTGDCRAATEQIAAFWRDRWLSSRVDNPAVLRETGRHETSFPISHGARVHLPEIDQDQHSFGELPFDVDLTTETADDHMGL
jgi:hypothetical protein